MSNSRNDVVEVDINLNESNNLNDSSDLNSTNDLNDSSDKNTSNTDTDKLLYKRKKEELESHVAQHYDEVDYKMVEAIWGSGNYHIGYFPHLKDSSCEEISFEEGAHLLNKRMISLGSIDDSSRIVDYGCGRGQGTLELVQLAKCSAIGIDIADVNLQYCNKRKIAHPELNLDFVQGSFVELPQQILTKRPKFTHLVSQQAIIHAHEFIDIILETARSILTKNGKLVISDWISLSNDHTPEFQKDLYERLELSCVISGDDYKKKLKKFGFRLDHYEDLTEHAAYGSRLIANKAKSLGYEHYYRDWSSTASLFENREVGVNLLVATKVDL